MQDAKQSKIVSATDGSTKNRTVAFVMPCLNEAATIEACVRRALEAIETLNTKHGITGEVIIADNGSNDGSQQLARSAGARVVDIDERGYGAALKGGFDAANADYLVMGDSDCSYDFLEAVAMVEKLEEGADFCMGSRFKGEIKPGAMPWKNRYIGNPVLSGILRFLFRTHISDSHCGIRALTRETYQRLNLASSGMEFASEMVLKAVMLKLRIEEVPVTLSPDGRDRPPHLSPWRDGFRHLVYMFMQSPIWLFVVPSLILFVFGTAIMLTLFFAGEAEMARIGNFGIGNHWVVVASSALIISLQTLILGFSALLGSYRDGFRQETPRSRKWLDRSRLHYWLGAGAGLIAVGFAWMSSIAYGWISSDFAGLNEMRSLIMACTLVVMGAQLFFSGFLLSIIAFNRSRHSAVLGIKKP